MIIVLTTFVLLFSVTRGQDISKEKQKKIGQKILYTFLLLFPET